MIIYMDEYRTVKEAPATWLKNGTYGEEVMQAAGIRRWSICCASRCPHPAPICRMTSRRSTSMRSSTAYTDLRQRFKALPRGSGGNAGIPPPPVLP